MIKNKKTLLFNGCSFMAGDELVWEKYCLEKKGYKLDWNDTWANKKTKELHKFLEEYRCDYRRLYNLPMQIAGHLGCDRIDLSEDGNSNDNIVLSTIAYLLNEPSEERKKFHVVIGWTSVSRFIKYLKRAPFVSSKSQFINLHVNHADGNHSQSELKDFQSFIDISFKTLDDEDLWLNFVKNIMLLENFLINNEVTYTFYRALGAKCDAQLLGPFQPFDLNIPNDKITNNLNWYDYVFKKYEDKHPYESDSWTCEILDSKENWINEKNAHPNLNLVTEFSKNLADFIRNQNVL